MAGFLKDKNILIMGLRNKWSIAWGIAKAAKQQGANLLITYQSDREKDSSSELAFRHIFNVIFLQMMK